MAEQIALQPSSTNAYLPFENFGGMHVSHEAGALNLLMLVQHPGFVIVCMLQQGLTMHFGLACMIPTRSLNAHAKRICSRHALCSRRAPCIELLTLLTKLQAALPCR